jgi:hypothetical protein
MGEQAALRAFPTASLLVMATTAAAAAAVVAWVTSSFTLGISCRLAPPCRRPRPCCRDTFQAVAIELEQFAYDAKVLDLPAFVKRHGDAFIVRSSADGDLTSQEWSHDQTKPAYKMGTIQSLQRLSYDGDKKSTSLFSVYPIRKSRSGPGIGITVGRKAQRDIVVADTTVSALHAEFSRKRDGSYTLIDKASRNGTMVNSDRLEPGKPYQVPDSATLQFGRVRMSWMRVAEFLDFVNTMMYACLVNHEQ